MRAFLLYFSQVVLASGVLYGYYHFFLRNKKFHQYNRFYLMASTVISLIAPLLRIDVYFTSAQDIPAVYQMMAEVRAGNAVHITNASSFVTWQNIVEFVLGLIAMIFFLRLILSLVYIARLIKNYPAEKLENISFINTEEQGTPFSFFRWLFWNKKINMESREGQKIFRHELFHIQQKHSWDIIYLELLATFFWINPFFHLIKKETKAIHEFLADQFAAGRDNKWEYAELLVRQTLQTRHKLVNPFFHNQIKRRIAMITNSSRPTFQYLRKVMVLPLTFFIITVVALNCTSKDIKDVQHDANNQKTDYQKLADLKKNLKEEVDKKIDSQLLKAVAQAKKDLIAAEENRIFSEAEGVPSFAGGQPGWVSFLQKNLNSNVPVDHGAPEGSYTVMTQFVVDKNGKISDLKALTHFGYGMEEEVLRVMKLSPDWKPAVQNGKVVKAYKKQPVTFVISSE